MKLTHKKVIESWPSAKAFADDIGVKAENARQMKIKGIPPYYYFVVTDAARDRGYLDITARQLMEMPIK